MRTRSAVGFAVAATVGGAAALSWFLWIAIAFGSGPRGETGQGAAAGGDSEPLRRPGATARDASPPATSQPVLFRY